MARPKSSGAGWLAADLGLGVYSAAKIRSLHKEASSHHNQVIKGLDRLSKSNDRRILGLREDTGRALVALRDNQRRNEERNQLRLEQIRAHFENVIGQSVVQLVEVNEKLTQLNNVAWQITGYIEAKLTQEEFRKDKRIVLFTIETILNNLSEFGDHFLPCQMFKMNQLELLVERHCLHANNFAGSSLDEMKKAQQILDRLANSRQECSQRLEEVEGAVQSFVLFEKLVKQITRYNRKTKPRIEKAIESLSGTLSEQKSELTQEKRRLNSIKKRLNSIPSDESRSLQIMVQARTIANLEDLIHNSTQHSEEIEEDYIEALHSAIEISKGEIQNLNETLNREREPLLSDLRNSEELIDGLKTSIKSLKSELNSLETEKNTASQLYDEWIEQLLPMLPEAINPSMLTDE